MRLRTRYQRLPPFHKAERSPVIGEAKCIGTGRQTKDWLERCAALCQLIDMGVRIGEISSQEFKIGRVFFSANHAVSIALECVVDVFTQRIDIP